jgi:predicted Rossmann fold nucleotide-binding protein DprA/Smf involved in DNA uptake
MDNASVAISWSSGLGAQRIPTKSAGCHRLLKEGGAVLVTAEAELTELVAG